MPKKFILFTQLMDSLRIIKLGTAKILLMNLDLLMFRESLLALNQWSTFTSYLFDKAERTPSPHDMNRQGLPPPPPPGDR